MKEDQQPYHDSVENWLHQTLGDPFQAAAPANAWERLEPFLPTPKKRRLPLVLWFFALTAMVGFATFGLWKTQQNQPIRPIATLIYQDNAQNNSAFSDAKTQPIAPSHFEEKQPPTAQTPYEAMAAVYNKNSESGSLLALEGPAIPAQNQFKSDVAPILPPNHAGLLPLAPLPTAIAPIPNHLPKRFWAFPVTEVVEKSKRANTFWFGIDAGPTHFFQKNNATTLPNLAFSEQLIGPVRGWQSAVTVAIEPRQHWKIGLGIQFAQQTYSAQHTATLRLLDGICLNPDDPGIKEYEFRYALVNKSGEQSHLSLRMQEQDPGTAMPVDEPFALDMHMTHHTSMWRVPISLERQFGSGKWRAFVRCGTAIEFAEKTKLEVVHFSEVCQDLCFKNNHAPTIQTSPTSSMLKADLLLSFGMERQINHRAAVRVEPIFIPKNSGLDAGLNIGILFSK